MSESKGGKKKMLKMEEWRKIGEEEVREGGMFWQEEIYYESFRDKWPE